MCMESIDHIPSDLPSPSLSSITFLYSESRMYSALIKIGESAFFEKWHSQTGGYFFGTVPDGRMVQETIHKWGKWPRYDKPMLKLQACWEGDVNKNPFGCGYTCAIGDTVTEGADSNPSLNGMQVNM